MRHNAKKSSRGRHQQQRKNGNSKTRVYESNGPDAKIRGTAYQITEKYELLAKDAETSGNHVLAENYRQHAEHYQRIISSFEEDDARQAKAKAEKEAAENQSTSTNDDLDLPASMVAKAPIEGDLATA